MIEDNTPEDLIDKLQGLSDTQLELIGEMVEQLRTSYRRIDRNPKSDLIDDCILRNLGDLLQIHHCISYEPFTKGRFEHAMRRAFDLCGHDARLSRSGNPGHDLTIDGTRFSLKTQADSNIRASKLWISKFMELGSGQWTNKDQDLIGLRKQYLDHLEQYERVVQLRCLSKDPTNWHYELVEIPKELLLEARAGELLMMHDSTQTPKPGYCYVKTDEGKLKYELYFDGGGERKLQIKHLLKEYCFVHAVWIFATEEESQSELPLGG